MKVLLKITSSLFFLLCFCLIGCKPGLLPKTKLDDTPENRRVVQFMSEYIKALEARSTEQVLALVSPDYFETNGNTDPTDDYDYDGLKNKLEQTFSKTKDLKVAIFIQKVIKQPGGDIHIIYYFRQNALMEFPAENKWMSSADVNRIVVGPDFKIKSGL